MPPRRGIPSGHGRPWPALGRSVLATVLVLLAACATVPDTERLLQAQPGAEVRAVSRPCNGKDAGGDAAAAAVAGELNPQRLRIASWNVHKGEDKGWQEDLGRYAAEHDLLLLQEAVMHDEMRAVIERAGHRWQMAGAFAQGGVERGVLIAARVPALSSCTLRSFEPLFPLPKSAMVARYRLQGHDKPLAVANLHGINFTLGLGRFGEQIESVARELALHDGPVIFAGDFNTWSQERHELLLSVARRLKLEPVEMVPDGRRRTFGMHLDHLFVRGFKVERAASPEVKSSDHNPILVVLALR